LQEKVVFATKCYYKDYYKFLQSYFDDKWKGCKYDFDDKWLILNNGIPEGTKFPCKTFAVSDCEKEVLDFFKLKRDDFLLNGHDGYKYSIAELTAIYLAKDFKYLCYIQSDCEMIPYNWITQGIKELETHSVVSPYSRVNTWGETDHFFSDQAFLIKVAEFRKPIYSIPGYMKEYPIYGGNYFEMMVGKYLHKTGKTRKIIKEAWYEHG
jgi:hypothetical protein